MKLLVIPKTKDFRSQLVDGYILPLQNFSVSYNLRYSLDEIKSFVLENKEIFVVINKNIFNNELPQLEKILIELTKVPISGVFFYDLSILSIVQRLHLDLPLIWNQTHMVTNYNTIQYYYSKGVTGAMLSNEITLEEMLEIRKQTNSKLFVNIIYQPVMSFSRRNLIQNYYKSSNIDSCDKNLVISEKVSGENLLVKEEKDGTTFFYGKLVNGLSAFPAFLESNFDYAIVDLNCLHDDWIEVCLPTIFNMIGGADNIGLTKIADLIGNYTGFLYKKTIYRVK